MKFFKLEQKKGEGVNKINLDIVWTIMYLQFFLLIFISDLFITDLLFIGLIK